MNKPSETFLALIADAGGIQQAAQRYAIPASTLYGVANGSRRLGVGLALRLHTATAGRFLAGDLMALPRSQDAP